MCKFKIHSLLFFKLIPFTSVRQIYIMYIDKEEKFDQLTENNERP